MRSRRNFSRISQISSPSRELSKRRISNIDIKEIVNKSPRYEITSPYSSKPLKKERSSFTPNFSPLGQYAFYFPKSRGKQSIQYKKLSIGLMPAKTRENLRYKNQSLEECDSYQNLNGVSTPPEEEINQLRTLSPFSEIMDEQLRKYIEHPVGKFGKLKFNRQSDIVDDSGTYSTNESRKKISSKFLFMQKKEEKSRPPKSVSIVSKIRSGKFTKLRGRNYK